MENWRNNIGLRPFDNIRKIQDQLQISINPFLKQQQLMADIMGGSAVFKTQEQFIRNFSGVNMLSEVAKSLKQSSIFNRQNLSAFDSFSKSMSWQAKFAIPQKTIDAISSINRQHEQIFGNLKTLTESVNFQSPAIAQINSLHLALSGISGHMASMAAQHRNWSLLDDYENITELAIEFTGTLTEELKEKEQARQFQILLSLVLSFLSKHKSLGVSALLIIDIFLRFAGFHQYYDFLQIKPELATKKELTQIGIKQDSTIFFIKQITEHLKQVKEYRITNNPCNIKLKPKQKTIIISKLPNEFDVIVIQVRHKWVYVSYFDPKDNLPQTGWIKKKYLNKPK